MIFMASIIAHTRISQHKKKDELHFLKKSTKSVSRQVLYPETPQNTYIFPIVP